MATAGSLPASGTQLLLREPTGEDELLVLESPGLDTTTMLALAARLARDVAGGPVGWLELPAVDLGAAALLVRQAWLGARIRTEALCPAPGCNEAIDVAFGITAYLDHHAPRPFRGVSELEPGWFALRGSDVRFRVPTIGDLIAVVEAPGSAQALLERCVVPADPPRAVAKRIDRALDAIAPRLDGEVSGTCPNCGQAVSLRFEPIGYVIEELRAASTVLFTHVHELAAAYHWSEEAILGLTARRRQGYVAMIRGELAVV